MFLSVWYPALDKISIHFLRVPGFESFYIPVTADRQLLCLSCEPAISLINRDHWENI